MQEIRHAANLLQRAVNQSENVADCLFSRFRRLLLPKDSMQHDLDHGEVLAQPIVQFSRNAPALLILRGNQADRETPQLTVQYFQLIRLSVQLRKYADLGPQQFR